MCFNLNRNLPQVRITYKNLKNNKSLDIFVVEQVR